MTSNREWLNGLATSDVSALNAWMDAEHVEGVEIQGEVCDFEHEADSREKPALKDDIATLRNELAKLQAENAELRDKLSAAIGHAHATCVLVDLEGNVV